MANFPSLSATSNVNDVIERFGNAANHIMAVFAIAMEGPSELSKSEREMIAAYTSALSNCLFCQRSHAGAAIALGANDGLLKSLLRDDAVNLPDKLKPIFQLARKVSVEAANIELIDIENVMSVGWSEQTAFDVLFVVSAFSMINRAASAGGVSISEAEGMQIGQFIAKNGYAAAVKEYAS